MSACMVQCTCLAEPAPFLTRPRPPNRPLIQNPAWTYGTGMETPWNHLWKLNHIISQHGYGNPISRALCSAGREARSSFSFGIGQDMATRQRGNTGFDTKHSRNIPIFEIAILGTGSPKRYSQHTCFYELPKCNSIARTYPPMLYSLNNIVFVRSRNATVSRERPLYRHILSAKLLLRIPEMQQYRTNGISNVISPQ